MSVKDILLGGVAVAIGASGASPAVALGMSVGELLAKGGVDTSHADFPKLLEQMSREMEVRPKDGSSIDDVYARLGGTS